MVRQAVTPSQELIAAVTAANAEPWFPELDAGRVRLHIHAADVRPRCFLYRVDLDDGRVSRRAVVKVRHSQPSLRRIDRYQQRPVLNPERTMSDHDSARREFDGLRQIGAAFEQAPAERYGVLRALAWLPGQSGIAMDLATEPTLREAMLGASRLRRRRGPGPHPHAWVNVGGWLRHFHEHCDDNLDLSTRNASRAQLAQMAGRYADFLVERLGRSQFRTQLCARAAEVVEGSLPADLPLRTGHGDFVAGNMFVSRSGRVTVFDPLPRWRVPMYQDLATVIVGMRVHPVQTTSQGLALSPRDLAQHERDLLAGYFDDRPVPLRAVRAYQLLVLLDKWSALVSKRLPAGRVRPHLHEARVRVAVHHYEREGRRLLGMLASQATAASSESG